MKCGLLGEKLSHSYSPVIHAAFGEKGYVLFEKKPEELPAFFREAPFDGINVTVPYKKAVLPFLSEMSETARHIGSVNTVVKRSDGSLFGDNTDVFGFSGTLRLSGIPLTGRKAVVLGSGGASAAVRYALSACGAEIVCVSRSGKDNYSNLSRHADADIFVNATPVGMYPDNGNSPLSLSYFPRLSAVFDLIYNPARTALLLEAEDRGIPAFNGLYMLVAQAAKSRELFTGVPVPEEKVRKITSSLRRDSVNIVLIGMPGSGKTSVASSLGKLTGREVYDSDDEVEKRTGRTPAAIIREDGEASFRKIETEVLSSLAKRSGIVLAAGGGAVTREENRAILRSNGRVVWIRRDISLLPREGRPLSAGDLAALWREREPKYRRFADFSVENDSSPHETAKKILEAL